jgi:hypothetical protein
MEADNSAVEIAEVKGTEKVAGHVSKKSGTNQNNHRK